ncbi:MAG: YlxR family protein [Candidatus Tectomicrobia bacterium]|uniref:YlxR family protein n=1 Tax=Tectimicrobiota bacterium TaxID=2528274 RepID=A0A932MNX0_UNCTE|nr:YlxR family protein [Candidatus Tectomicrobia bacterium]
MPVRTCIGCRTKGEADAFFRMVADPGGGVAAELDSRLPGRGAHCCFRASCIQAALKPKNLARALREGIQAPGPGELAERVEELLRRRLEGLLAAAWRKGVLTPGRDAAFRELAEGGRLLLARDLSAGSRSEIPKEARPPLELPLRMEEIGRLLGRSPAGVLALRDVSLEEAVALRLAQLKSLAEG